MKICYVIECGWIIIGEKDVLGAGVICLKNAAVVRRWNNSLGIGGIAKAEHKDEYILDDIGDVNIRAEKVLFEIPCEW